LIEKPRGAFVTLCHPNASRDKGFKPLPGGHLRGALGHFVIASEVLFF
jgi:hypothetical protein